MSKLYSVLAGCLLSLLAAGSQSAQGQALPGRVCATQEADALRQAELKRLNPLYNPAKSTAPDRKILRTSAVTYTLPVIVHVIHNGEAVGVGTNISQAQVQSQLDVLNEDYRKTNADGAMVPGVYQPLRADVEVQFVAATRDPNGNTLAEPGIDRVDRNAKNFTAPPYGGTTSPNTTYIDGTIKPQTYWNPDQYINIWVMDLNGGGLLGYAQFPDNTAGLGGLSASGGSAATDGVVVKHSAYGSRAKNPTGTYINSFDKGRTLTHELGHWLGLRHIWGDAACGNDYCADTPTQQTSNGGCPAFPHITCSNVTGDMSMNYMDYTYDACMYMFSAGQKDRIQAVMAANTPRRSTLVNSPVLCAAAVAATATNSGAACVGSTVTLTATGPAGATYRWTGPNGYTSTSQNPTLTNVTTASAGVYSVVVTLVPGACPAPATRTTTVAVSTAPPVPVLATSAAAVCPGTSATLSTNNLVAGALPNENFNGAATGWTLANAGTASTSWQYSSSYTYSSSYLTLSGYSLDGTRFAIANSDAGGSSSSTNTTLTSPAFSTVGYSGLQLSFLQAFRYGNGDVAVVEASTDGITWTAASTFTASVGTATTPATTTVNLNAFVNQPSVRVRWRYAASWAYYWAIDNVQFTGTQPTPIYTWTLVSGDGLPAVANTATIAVTPTQNSVYRLSIGYAGGGCTSSATIAVNITAPVWTGAGGDGNWFNASNWTGCVPNRFTDTTIPAGLTTTYPTLISGGGTAEVRNLTQQGSLTMTGGQLDLYGNHLGTGPLVLLNGIVATRSTVAQSLRNATYATLLIGGTGTKTIGTATVGTALNLAGGILSTGTATVTLAPAATITETDASYVLGLVQTTHTVGTTTDTFGGLGLGLTAAVAPGATTVVRTTGQPQGTGTAVSIGRYYDITAATSRSLQGATLVQGYLPHELNGIAASQLTMFKSANTGTTWTNEGATQRDATANLVSRNFVTDVQGRWTLGSATAPLAPATVAYSIVALPIPFTSAGLSLQVTTPTAGPLHVKLYDILGRAIYDHAVANVEVGTSTVSLPGSGQLQPGKYILVVQQANQEVRTNVVHGQ